MAEEEEAAAVVAAAVEEVLVDMAGAGVAAKVETLARQVPSCSCLSSLADQFLSSALVCAVRSVTRGKGLQQGLSFDLSGPRRKSMPKNV